MGEPRNHRPGLNHAPPDHTMSDAAANPDSRLSDLRGDLDAIVAGALDAVDPELLVGQALQDLGLAESDRPLHLVAVGKAALGMARGALFLLGGRIRDGIVLAPDSPEARSRARAIDWPPEIALRWGGHPLPDRAGVRAAEEIRGRAEAAGEGDILLFLLSGGGSALLTLPRDGIALSDVRAVTAGLLAGGADIGELNTVRKHLDRLKGGGLARAAHPASTEALVLSDVVGDPLDVIASGPVSPDPTTFEDALDVLVKRFEGEIPPSVADLLERGRSGAVEESPKPGDPCFGEVRVTVIGNASTALLGAADHARRRGYEVRTGSTRVTGEARDVGVRLGEIARVVAREASESGRPICYVSAGETTVTVTGGGHGGRNQELALSAGLEAIGGTPFDGEPTRAVVMVASIGTDGVDGTRPPGDGGPAAGAWVSPLRDAAEHPVGLLPAEALVRNDTYRHFAEAETAFGQERGAGGEGALPGAPLGGGLVGGHIRTGPTGTNVMDLHVVLARP